MFRNEIVDKKGLFEGSFSGVFDPYKDICNDDDDFALDKGEGDFVVFKADFSGQSKLFEYLISSLFYSQAIKYECRGGYVFVKTVFRTDMSFSGLMSNGENLYVANYLLYELKKLNEYKKFSSYHERNVENCSRIIASIYGDKGVSMFPMLQDYDLDFCTVIYDSDKEKLVAGSVSPDEYGINSYLYCGHTIDNTLMISSYSSIIDKFCVDKYKMPRNSYMVDECIYNFNGEIIKNMKKNNNSNDNKENFDSFFNGLNNLLSDIATDSVKEKIEEYVSNYLSDEENIRRINNFVQDNIDKGNKEELYKVLKKR